MTQSSVRSLNDNIVDIISYALSFSSFYLFVYLARRRVASIPPSSTSPIDKLIAACVLEQRDEEGSFDQARKPERKQEKQLWGSAFKLLVCFLGIQLSYLLWGLLQERIMTKPYESGEIFKSSKFLVFANRFLALLVAWGTLAIMRQYGGEPVSSAPLYRFSYSSVSNILSSVCQYEALRYVSFPTQVVAKSCKMIPVMLMGYVVTGTRYSSLEYIVAITITTGAVIFKLYEVNDAPVQNTEFVGIVLISAYMMFDSFTSNWQSKLFKQYHIGSVTMMLYSNLFSAAFTALGLLVSLECVQVASFLASNPTIHMHIMIMSICSATGQLFIFFTIKEFGPLVFATIQTTRQLLSICLSIFMFSHPINNMEILGITLVFVALAVQTLHKSYGKIDRVQQVQKPETINLENADDDIRIHSEDDIVDDKTPLTRVT